MNTKFTPGPWHLSKAFGQQGLIGPDIGYPVAAVTGYYMSVGQTEANAHLIASAPKLFALVKRFDEFANADSSFIYPPGSLQELKEAIAAATGENA